MKNDSHKIWQQQPQQRNVWICKLPAGERLRSILPHLILLFSSEQCPECRDLLSASILPLISSNCKSRLPFWFRLFFVLLSPYLWKCLLLVSPHAPHFPSSFSHYRPVSFRLLSHSLREKWERETLTITNQAFDSNGIMRRRLNSEVMEGWRPTPVKMRLYRSNNASFWGPWIREDGR